MPSGTSATSTGFRIFLDATRLVENAFFIQDREPGYADKTIAEILQEFCSYTDGAWMSARRTRWSTSAAGSPLNDDGAVR